MSREIKFRGVSVEAGSFLYGVPLVSGKHAFIITTENRACDLGSGVKPETVSQYTCLKDKNGIEVYVNDIVEDEYGRRYEVVFEGYCLRCNGVRKKKGGHKPKNRWFGKDLKIIGNRYENPELLKER